MAKKNPNLTPWDVYIDECKLDDHHTIGFLLVPNTASFAHKLFLCRHRPPDSSGRRRETRELHWAEFHRNLIWTAKKWYDTVFQHRGVKFYLVEWPKDEAKEVVILRFLARMCRTKKLSPPYNVAAILDYDSGHARARIQNSIREAGQIARCYHLDSQKNDCIQCCDMLLGATVRLAIDETIRGDYDALDDRWKQGNRLKASEAKRYIAGYLAKLIDSDEKCVYDTRTKCR